MKLLLGGPGTYPEPRRVFTLAFEHVGGGAVVADVGHAAADEHLIDGCASYIGEGFDVVWVVGAGQDGLVNPRVSWCQLSVALENQPYRPLSLIEHLFRPRGLY